MEFNDKTTLLEEYSSPSVQTILIKCEGVICGSFKTGEKVGDSEDWDGDDEWK